MASPSRAEVEGREKAFRAMSDLDLLNRTRDVLVADAPRLASGQWNAWFVPSSERVLTVLANEEQFEEAQPCHCLVGAGLQAGGCYWTNDDVPVTVSMHYSIPAELVPLEREVIERLTGLLYDHLNKRVILGHLIKHAQGRAGNSSPWFHDYLCDDREIPRTSRPDVLYGYSDYVLHPLGAVGKDEAIKVYERAIAAVSA